MSGNNTEFQSREQEVARQDKSNPDALLAFADSTRRQADPAPGAPWRILVVDDDPDVFAVTSVVLQDVRFKNRPLRLHQAISATEAGKILEREQDFAVILLDVIMESPNAGLGLVKRVREEFRNDRTRIILRTGQPGQIPERGAFLAYDINDYLSKIDLTDDRLFTAVISALRSYRQIQALESARACAESLHKQLAQAQKMEALGRLAGGIAHDFNNILATVIGASEVALDALPEDSGARPYVRSAFDAGLRGRALVRRILTFGRPARHERRTIDIRPVVEETMALMRATAPASITVEVTLPAQAMPIEGDPVQIQQVLINLCANAMQAMPDGGNLTVAVEPDSRGTVGVHMADTGVGMDALTQQRMFDPFFTTRHDETGTGLGLSVVHGIVAAHGGRLAVDSAPGQGTRITFRLPLVDAPLDESVAPALGPAPRGESQRILVVDDEAPLIDIVLETLDKLGYEAEGFADPRAAVQAVREAPRRYDLVLTDHRMPYFSGLTLAQMVREVAPTVPVLLLTGNANAVDRDKALKMGVHRVLEKPLMSEDLATALAEALRQTQP